MEERDLVFAEKVGGLTQAVESMRDKLDDYCRRNEEQHSAMWVRLDKHSDTLGYHNGIMKWIIGIGIGIQAAWFSILAWIKH